MEFRSNGKILLSGEYFIIDGAKAIGIPCNKGQRIKINKIKMRILSHGNPMTTIKCYGLNLNLTSKLLK